MAASELWAAFPVLDPTDPALRTELAVRPVVSLEAGRVLVREGEECSGAPMVLEGGLQVAKASEGRQIRLYTLGPGECCPLTTSCLMGDDPFPAAVVVEVATRAVLVPPELFLSLVGRSPSFRRLVFGQFTRRLGSVIGLVEALAFRRLDERLGEFLTLNAVNGVVALTHQEIADRLGTSREVVSRLLKELEAAGRVIMGRGQLRLTR